ncbi:MAG: hypothetical protein GEU83_18495 [Pseudonocardiaceae bacterium]|nr:hypothetical protein [Pseudonocardiaceae bacterium]
MCDPALDSCHVLRVPIRIEDAEPGPIVDMLDLSSSGLGRTVALDIIDRSENSSYRKDWLIAAGATVRSSNPAA